LIIDCHAHVFQHWAGAGGHESREIHWKYIQKNLTRPAAKIRRARDGAPATGQDLFRAGDNTWAGLRGDLAFRVGPFGRLEDTLDGEDSYIQYTNVERFCTYRQCLDYALRYCDFLSAKDKGLRLGESVAGLCEITATSA